MTRTTETSTWRDWAGTVTARPRRVIAPASVAEPASAARAAAEAGLTAKAVGTGRSLPATAATEGVPIRPERLTAVRSVDPRAGTVTVEAGLPLHRLNRPLDASGLSLTNRGDIMEQTVAGAVSTGTGTGTGTHGTGRASGSLAAQVTALQLLLADGSVLEGSVLDCSTARPSRTRTSSPPPGSASARSGSSQRSPSPSSRRSC